MTNMIPLTCSRAPKVYHERNQLKSPSPNHDSKLPSWRVHPSHVCFTHIHTYVLYDIIFTIPLGSTFTMQSLPNVGKYMPYIYLIGYV